MLITLETNNGVWKFDPTKLVKCRKGDNNDIIYTFETDKGTEVNFLTFQNQKYRDKCWGVFLQNCFDVSSDIPPDILDLTEVYFK